MDLKKYLPSEKTSRLILFSVAAIAVIFMAVNIYSHRATKYVDDFKIYYYTGKAFNSGLNPYEAASINKEAGFDLRTIYRYAPYTLYVFGLMAKLKYDTALAVFMGLKVLIAIFLFFIWINYLLKEKYGLIFTIFFIAGFDASIYIDLKFANISLYEQFFIWLGFYFFLNKKNAMFTVCLILASMFKFWPILLLFAYLAADARKNLKYLVLSFGAFAAIQIVLYFMMPNLYPSFINSSPITETGGGGNNTSSYLFFRDLFAALKISGIIPVTAYVLWAAVFAGLTAFFMFKHKAGGSLVRIFFILAAYCLIVPRMKNYSYIMLLPVAYYFTTQAIRSRWSWLVLLLFCENMTCGFVPVILCEYYYLFTIVLIWVFGLIVLKREDKAGLTRL